jgi:hypothetical protein
MKKIPHILAAAFLAQGVSSAAAAGAGGNVVCMILFVLLVIMPAVGVFVMALQVVRWITSPFDPTARDNAKKGVLYVVVGLIAVLLATSVVVLLSGGPDRFYSCVYSNNASNVAVEAPVVLSGSKYIATLNLYEGWNLFSTPIVLEDPNASRLFSNVDYDIIYSWDASSGVWLYQTPERAGNLAAIEIDRGYWIHMLKNATIVLNGRAVVSDRNVSLVSGWNLVGYSGYYSVPLSTALGNVDCLYIYSWNATQALASSYGVGWSFHSNRGFSPSKAPPKPPAMKEPAFPGMTALSAIEPGRGYWIYVNGSAYWAYPTNYPK